MSKSKRYTKEQKHLIKQCIIDADIMGLGRAESITYVKSRLGLDDKTSFSEGSYKKYKTETLLSDETNVEWITYYARQGFVEFYRKRIQEMEMIQKETFKQWLVETNRPDSQKDKRLILSLVAELRANNIVTRNIKNENLKGASALHLSLQQQEEPCFRVMYDK